MASSAVIPKCGDNFFLKKYEKYLILGFCKFPPEIQGKKNYRKNIKAF